MSEKVKLTAKQENRIIEFQKSYSNEKIVSDFVTSELDAREGLTVDTLIRALYIGYEVEETPEEKVFKYSKQLCADHDVWSKCHQSNTSPFGHELTGCIRTLNLLNIKIDGVNT